MIYVDVRVNKNSDLNFTDAEKMFKTESKGL